MQKERENKRKEYKKMRSKNTSLNISLGKNDGQDLRKMDINNFFNTINTAKTTTNKQKRDSL